MNNNTPPLLPRDTLQARFALRVTARLTEHSATALPADAGERLRFAREQAIARAQLRRRHAEQAAPAVAVGGSGTAALFGWGGGTPWWMKLASLMPLVLLLAGLTFIQQWHDRSQIAAAAEIDAALLSDDLPPDAYADPGFVEFLKSPTP